MSTRSATCFVIALIAMLKPAMTSAAERPLNLLFFGNSYSQGGVQFRVQDLALADGHAMPNVLTHTMGGQDLAWHLGQVQTNPQNSVTNALIAGKTWDRVIIQAHSSEATKFDGNAVPYRADAVNLFSAVRNHASGYGPNATAIQMETWARGVGNTEGWYNPGAYANPAAMQADVTKNTALASADINAALGAGSSVVAPVGQAFGLFGWQPWLYQSDLHHQSVNGNLLQSLVVYRAVYNESVSDITFAEWQAVDRTDAPYKVDATTWASLTAAADSLVITAVPEPASVALLTFALVTASTCRPRRSTAV